MIGLSLPHVAGQVVTQANHFCSELQTLNNHYNLPGLSCKLRPAFFEDVYDM
jgi:hypothetical protein